MKREGAANIWVDADPKLGDRVSLFGKMNEDLHTVKYNAEIGEDGFIRILKTQKMRSSSQDTGNQTMTGMT